MGKRLDAIALRLLLISAASIWFLYVGLPAYAAVLLGIVGGVCAFVLARDIKKRLPPRKAPSGRQRKAWAEACLKKLPQRPEAEALTDAFEWLKTRYPLTEPVYRDGFLRAKHADTPVSIGMIQKMRVSPDDLLALWKRAANTPERTLIALIPGKSDPEIRLLADRLTDPGAVILDRDQLRALIRKNSVKPDAPEQARRKPLLTSLGAYIARRKTNRYLLYALPLTGYYLLTGKWPYLAAAAALLLMAGLGLKRARAPESLI